MRPSQSRLSRPIKWKPRSILTNQTNAMKLTIKQRIRNWLLDSDDVPKDTVGQDSSPQLQSQGITLQIYKASGGFVVEHTRYDARKDDNVHSIYIVTNEQDLGKELGQIIVLETLKA